MKKNSIVLCLMIILSSALFSSSGKWGLKKPSVHTPLERSFTVKESDYNLSLALGSFSSSGDLSTSYESGGSIDFLIDCKKSCSIMGKDLSLGLGLSFVSMCSDQEDVPGLGLFTAGMRVMPKLNLPVDLDLGIGLGTAPGEANNVDNFGYVSFDVFYPLPFCKGVSAGIQFKNIIENVDGEVSTNRLSNLGFALKIEG